MSEHGSVFTCKNHTTLRWANTKPGGRIFFLGEIMEDGRLKPDHPISPFPPMKILKARLNGKNPYDERLDEPEMTSWAELLDFMEYYTSSMQKYAFECECPGADIIRVDDETYESVTQREQTTS
jgi:hypothetical protein